MDVVDELIQTELGLTNLKYLESKNGYISEGRVYDIGDNNKIFVKVNTKEQARRMFEGEQVSIQDLSNTGLLRLPKPFKLIDLPESGAAQVLEYIEMNRLTSAQSEMGKQLARLHLDNQKKLKRWKKMENFVGSNSKTETPVERFGYRMTTCCGYLPQYTNWENDWSTFYTRKLDDRISYVVKRDGDKEVNEIWNNIMGYIPRVFSGISITPSLLHGDFWRGNSGQTLDKSPVMFDPCCFYGHSEFDLAIGFVVPGFDAEFYHSYFELIPKETGFEDRLDLAHFGVDFDENCKRQDVIKLMKKIEKNVKS